LANMLLKALRFSTPTPSDQKKCHFSTNSIWSCDCWRRNYVE
jgi:hypothetical protein